MVKNSNKSKIKSKKGANKSKSNSRKSSNKKRGSSVAFWRDNRLPKVLAALCTLFAVYLIIAFVSYLGTWETDQDKIFNMPWSDVFTSEIALDNDLGRLGGMVAHQFIYKWFGVISFLFPVFLLIAAFKLFFENVYLNLSKIAKYGLFVVGWTSVTLAYLFSESIFSYGGGFGNAINDWLFAFIGYIGTGVLIVFALLLLLFLTYEFEFSLPQMKGVDLDRVKPKTSLFKGFNFKWPKFGSENYDDEEFESAAANNYLKPKKAKKPIQNLNEKLTLELGEEKSLDIQQEPEIPKTLVIEEDVAIKAKPKTKETEAPDFQVSSVVEEAKGTHLTVDTQYDPTLDLGRYEYPPLDLLENYGDDQITIDREQLDKYKDQIIDTLLNYKIQITKIKATVGPTVTLYEIVPAPGVKISKIKNLEDDIALSLAALGIRIIAPMPGKGTIGIEVPNVKTQIVSMLTVLSSEKFLSSDYELPIGLGKTISNEVWVGDLAKIPHLLIAGATGQGKSVGLNAILVSLLYKKHPSQLKFVLVDPKKVELSLFNHIENHFLAKLPGEEEAIITDTRKVITTLNALCLEMDNRYDLLKLAQAKKISEYNNKFVARKLNPNNGHKFMPYIVLVIDEFADLMMVAGKEVEMPIARLAQLARAVGIHLIIATQRPSVNIITGTIKANFPGRIAFRVTSKVDSRTILDTGGADQLIGRGDMLLSINSETVRLQCAFVDTPEVERIAEFIGEQQGYPEAHLLPEFLTDEEAIARGEIRLTDRDDNFEDAARLIVTHQSGSTSLIQRKMKLGYNRAGRIMDQLEMVGIVGPSNGSKAREVLISDLYTLEQFLNQL